MSGRGYESRKRWNSANYKQLNVAINAELAEAFKAACEVNGEPARQAVVRMVSEYISGAQPVERVSADIDYSSRTKRKKAVGKLLEQLVTMRDAEEDYMNSIPVNMYNKQEDAERAVEMYEDAIAAIEELRSI
jgi:hypothetical protein